ncbi:MAG TPA: cation:dicarboxylase symporter family transporter [Caulobacteraceae bacterium]|jgi:Na+/H+-dicarboxylate symporter|nr:cation:dicarboxylase symporter family transporter [Caulobacteraceae bacterium]
MNLNALAPRILAGMALGLAVSAGIDWFAPNALGIDWRASAAGLGNALGGAWLAALRMTIVPLVFALVFVGVTRSADVVQGGGNAARTVVTFAVLLLASAALGAIAASGALRVWPISAPVAQAMRQMAGVGAPHPAQATLSDWISSLIPVNPVKAAADGAMAPLVVFALVFGLAATRQTGERRASLAGFFEAVQATMLTIVGWVLIAAPVGVFFLALSIGARVGLGVAATLGQYAILVSVVCLIGALPAMALALFSRTPLLKLFAAFLPSQLMALSTQSSIATLPVMLQGAETLGVPERIRGLVTPMAVALFRATNPAATMAIVLYVAGVYGVAIPLPKLLISVGLAALMSLAGVGVASSVAFATVLIPLCIAMNLPIAILPLLLSVEPILDFARTLGNVTADLAVTVWAGRWKSTEQEKELPTKNTKSTNS